MNTASRNRHATIGGFLASNHSSSCLNLREKVHAKSAATAVQAGLSNCVVSITEDYRYRNRNVIIPLTIVTLSNELSPGAVELVLNFMYCGELEPQLSPRPTSSSVESTGHARAPSTSSRAANCNDLLKVAEAFEIESLRDVLAEKVAQGIGCDSDPVYADAQFLTERSTHLIELGVESGLFSGKRGTGKRRRTKVP